uniref:Uncharacterized protein n=1 Tax=Timema douglasi TaxID=61478 RepID=A0A7R8VNS9_TIMDO|nr:unnamed protein product [Timema douglasi]
MGAHKDAEHESGYFEDEEDDEEMTRKLTIRTEQSTSSGHKSTSMDINCTSIEHQHMDSKIPGDERMFIKANLDDKFRQDEVTGEQMRVLCDCSDSESQSQPPRPRTSGSCCHTAFQVMSY